MRLQGFGKKSTSRFHVVGTYSRPISRTGGVIIANSGPVIKPSFATASQEIRAAGNISKAILLRCGIIKYQRQEQRIGHAHVFHSHNEKAIPNVGQRGAAARKEGLQSPIDCIIGPTAANGLLNGRDYLVEGVKIVRAGAPCALLGFARIPVFRNIWRLVAFRLSWE